MEKSFFSNIFTLKNFNHYSLLVSRTIVFLILSGAFVRLTGSGLGCPDWPNCETNSFVAPASFHPFVEDVNRFINAGATIVIVAAFVFAISLKPKRRDLRILSGLLLLSIFAQIIMGAVVVYSHLWPPFVIVHFLLTMAMLAVSVILHHYSKYARLTKDPVLKRDLKIRLNIVLALIGLVIISGSMASGAGPYGGSPGVKRLPLAFRDAVFIHIFIVSLFTIFLVSLISYLHRNQYMFERKLRWFYATLGATLIQAGIGLSQYNLRDSIYLVELHLLGACVVLSLCVKSFLVINTEGALSNAHSKSYKIPLL